MLRLRRVVGTSMEPTLTNGSVVLTVGSRCQAGDVVIAHTNDGQVVKRVTEVLGNTIKLCGDNKAASSRYSVEKSDILGRVIWPKTKPQK